MGKNRRQAISQAGGPPDAELAELLAPIDPASFVARHWQKMPLHIKGDAAKITRLLPGGLSRDDVFRRVFVSSQLEGEGPRLLAQRGAGLPHREGERPATRINPRNARRAAAEGCEVQVHGLADARTTTLIARLKAQLGHTGKCTVAATLSPAGFGRSVHREPVDTFRIQLEGRKRFFLSDARGSGCREVVLKPGEILYCPAGVLQRMKAVDDAATLIFNFEAGAAPDLRLSVLRSRLSEPASTSPPAPAIGDEPIRPGDHFRFNRRAPFSHCVDSEGDDGGDRIHVFSASHAITGEGDLYWLLRHLVERREFVAREATRWVKHRAARPWDAVEKALAVLLRHGVISRTSKTSKTSKKTAARRSRA